MTTYDLAVKLLEQGISNYIVNVDIIANKYYVFIRNDEYSISELIEKEQFDFIVNMIRKANELKRLDKERNFRLEILAELGLTE